MKSPCMLYDRGARNGEVAACPLLPLGVRRTGRDQWLDPGKVRVKGSPAIGASRTIMLAIHSPALIIACIEIAFLI